MESYEYDIYYLFDQSVPRFEPIRSLSDAEVSSILDAEKIMYEFEYYRRRKIEVELNISDVLAVIEKHRLRVLNSDVTNQDSEFVTEIFVDVNRVVSNLISSIKIFVDHFDKRLKLKLGEGSKKYITFKAKLSLLYDTIDGYRIFINLRNFSQHVNRFPINKVSIKRDFSLTKGVALDIFVDKKQLLEDETLKAKLGSLLIHYNDFFPLEPLVIQLESVVPKIFLLFVEAESDYYTKAANELLSFVGENKGKATGLGKIVLEFGLEKFS